jgi:hypothetical protein
MSNIFFEFDHPPFCTGTCVFFFFLIIACRPFCTLRLRQGRRWGRDLSCCLFIYFIITIIIDAGHSAFCACVRDVGACVRSNMMNMYVYVHVCACVCMCVCVCACACMYDRCAYNVQIYIHTHTYRCIYVCTHINLVFSASDAPLKSSHSRSILERVPGKSGVCVCPCVCPEGSSDIIHTPSDGGR